MSSEAKKHAASDAKLAKQRDEGNVPNVAEISGIAGGIASILVLFALAKQILKRLEVAFEAPAITDDLAFQYALQTALSSIGSALALAVAPIVLSATVTSVLTSLLYNRGIVFSVKPITPKLDRISPLAGFKRIFGKRTFVEIIAALIRLSIWIAAALFICGIVLVPLFRLDYCGTGCTVDIALYIVMRLAILLVFLLFVTIIAEMIIQRRLFLHEQRMTDSEVKKEQKRNFGSNEIRQERNRVRQENDQLADSSGVNKANMCFFHGDRAIAIRYHPEYAKIPQLAAKANTLDGTAKLRAKVAENGFTELEHKDVVEAVFGTAIGQTVGDGARQHLVDAMTKLFSRAT